MSESAETRDSSSIVPLIKRAEVEGAGNPPPEGMSESDYPVLESLASYLVVAYAFDLPDHFQYVTPRHCQRLGLDEGELRELSVRNLTRLRQKPIIKQGTASAGFVFDGNLESSLLLVDHLWTQLAPQLAGDILVAVPARDTLAFTGTEIPGGIDALNRGVEAVWRVSETRLLLTKSLLIRRENTWYPFRRHRSLDR